MKIGLKHRPVFNDNFLSFYSIVCSSLLLDISSKQKSAQYHDKQLIQISSQQLTSKMNYSILNLNLTFSSKFQKSLDL